MVPTHTNTNTWMRVHVLTHTLQGSPLSCRSTHTHTHILQGSLHCPVEIHTRTRTHTLTHMQKAQGVFVALSETQLFRAETKAPRSRRWTINVHTERDKAGLPRQQGRFSNHCRASQLISSVVTVPLLGAPVTVPTPSSTSWQWESGSQGSVNHSHT